MYEHFQGAAKDILKGSIQDGFAMLSKAKEVKEEAKLYQVWCSLLPLMAQGLMDFVSFDDYKKRVLQPIANHSDRNNGVIKSNSKTDEEILADVESILNMQLIEDSSF